MKQTLRRTTRGAALAVLAFGVAGCGGSTIDTPSETARAPVPASSRAPRSRERTLEAAVPDQTTPPSSPAPPLTTDARIAALRRSVEAAARERVVDLSANAEAAELGEAGIAALVDLAESTKDDEVRSIAYYTLWYMPARAVRTPSGRRALAGMLAWLEHPPAAEDPRENLRVVLPTFVWLAGPDATEFVPQLTKLLRSDDPWVRQMALLAVRSGQRFVRDALPGVIACCDDPTVETRALAAGAIESIGLQRDECGQPLLRLAVDSEQSVRNAAISALRQVHPRVEEAMLAPLQSHEDPLVREAAVRLRAPASPDPIPVNWTMDQDAAGSPVPVANSDDLPTLVELMCIDPGPALLKFARLGPSANSAKPAIRAILDRGVEPDWAVAAYVSICRDEPTLVDDLIALLEGVDRAAIRSTHSSRDHAEVAAARNLGLLGDRARPALTALRLATLASRPDLRAEAAAAIAKIEGR